MAKKATKIYGAEKRSVTSLTTGIASPATPLTSATTTLISNSSANSSWLHDSCTKKESQVFNSNSWAAAGNHLCSSSQTRQVNQSAKERRQTKSLFIFCEMQIIIGEHQTKTSNTFSNCSICQSPSFRKKFEEKSHNSKIQLMYKTLLMTLTSSIGGTFCQSVPNLL